MFLAEYVIATATSRCWKALSAGVESRPWPSGVGLVGPQVRQTRTANLDGYGAMNQPGLSLTVSLVLARQAGVKDPDLDRAIGRSANFLRWFDNKGAIPYGDHRPWPGHEDNGNVPARLFCRPGWAIARRVVSTPNVYSSLRERERGHTGNFFNMLWRCPEFRAVVRWPRAAYNERIGMVL